MFNRKGQNTAEYAILIALIIGAAIAMQTYVKRGLQGGTKFAVDKLKKDDVATSTGQYEPYYVESSYTNTQHDYTDTEETKASDNVIRTFGVNKAKETDRSGYQALRSPDGTLPMP